MDQNNQQNQDYDDPNPELFPIEFNENALGAFDYWDGRFVNGGLIRDVFNNDREAILRKLASKCSVRVTDNKGNSLMHIAVHSYRNDDSILKLLLLQDDTDINAVNYEMDTPLATSLKLKKGSVALYLIMHGANVNLPEHITPLHLYCLQPTLNSALGVKLIKEGAKVNAQDVYGNTPLHCAVVKNDLEKVCLLLCYGADFRKNNDEETPFEMSLTLRRFDLADVMFDYVPEFYTSTLNTAIINNYPNLHQLIKRIIAENKYFVCNPDRDTFIALMNRPESFELIWKNVILRYDYNVILFQIFSTDLSNWESVMDVIMKGSQEHLITITEVSDNFPVMYLMAYFIMCQSDHITERDMKYIENFLFFLLSNGLNVLTFDLEMVFELFGYHELFKLMLNMNVKVANRTKYNILPHFIYLVDDYFTINVRFRNFHAVMKDKEPLATTETDLVHLHLTSPIIAKGFPVRVPKLQELARNKFRDFLCKKYKIKSSGQFHTILRLMLLPRPIKELIMFEIPLYGKLPPDNLEARKKRWPIMLGQISYRR